MGLTIEMKSSEYMSSLNTTGLPILNLPEPIVRSRAVYGLDEYISSVFFSSGSLSSNSSTSSYSSSASLSFWSDWDSSWFSSSLASVSSSPDYVSWCKTLCACASSLSYSYIFSWSSWSNLSESILCSFKLSHISLIVWSYQNISGIPIKENMAK